MAMSLFQEHKDRSKLEKLINLIILVKKTESHIYQQVLQMHLTQFPAIADKFSKNRNADSKKDNLPTQIM